MLDVDNLTAKTRVHSSISIIKDVLKGTGFLSARKGVSLILIDGGWTGDLAGNCLLDYFYGLKLGYTPMEIANELVFL